MSEIWSQSLFGKVIDLADPVVEEVDIWEICKTLSGINRYSGSSEQPVSDATHTLIVFDAAARGHRGLDPYNLSLILAYCLAHDMHEARLGDWTTPAMQALGAVAEEMGARPDFIDRAVKHLKARHDLVIWKAIGLAPPDAFQRAAIKHADLVALKTERRDFLTKPPKPWADAIEEVECLDHQYHHLTFGRDKARVACTLYARCEQYFPYLKAKAKVAA